MDRLTLKKKTNSNIKKTTNVKKSSAKKSIIKKSLIKKSKTNDNDSSTDDSSSDDSSTDFSSDDSNTDDSSSDDSSDKDTNDIDNSESSEDDKEKTKKQNNVKPNKLIKTLELNSKPKDKKGKTIEFNLKDANKKVKKYKDDMIDSEVENASIKLPLKNSDIIKLKLNKNESIDKKKKLMNIPLFGMDNSDDDNENEKSSAKSVSDNDSDDESKCNKKCCDCKKKTKKISDLKKIITELKKNVKDLSENVKSVNGIESKEKTAVLSKLNIMDVVNGKKINLKNNNYNCQHCCEGFDNVPCVIPEKYYKKKFYVFGWYCSFNCSAADIITLGGYNVWTRMSILHVLYKHIFGIYKKIKPAANKLELKSNGGDKTITEFRENSLIIDKESRIKFPPMIAILPTIENDYINDGNEIGNANICLAKANKKTRRSKPPQHGLVKSMGLKINKK